MDFSAAGRDRDLVDKRFVRVRVHASSWKGALLLACRPMIDAGCMTEDYCRQMVDFYDRLGQHAAVVAPPCAARTPAEALSILWGYCDRLAG